MLISDEYLTKKYPLLYYVILAYEHEIVMLNNHVNLSNVNKQKRKNNVLKYKKNDETMT